MNVIKPEGYLAVPKNGKGPGVLVLHAWWGLNPFFRGLCERLAAEGLVAFAPDLYHGQVAVTVEEATRLRDSLKDEQAQADLYAAIDYLRELEGVSEGGLGAIGFSLGSNFALGVSGERPQDIRAVVAFYGTGGGDFASAKAAYLGHFGETDEWEPLEGVQWLEGELHKAGRQATFYMYPGTGHWFFEEDRPEAYNAQAAGLAWERTLRFLKVTLTATTKP
jgi:carboxymethylenebutenolidase